MSPEVISGVFGLGAGAINLGSTALANASNERMQREQNNWNAMMWNLNNQYNSPANQIQRLKAAGMNPDLMYGNPSQGTSVAPAQGSNPISKQAMFIDPMTMANIGVAMAQKKNIEADTEQKEAQTTNITNENSKFTEKWDLFFKQTNKEIDFLQTQIDEKLLLVPKQRELLINQIDTEAEKKKLTAGQVIYQDLENIYNRSTLPKRIEQVGIQNHLMRSEINHFNALCRKLQSEIALNAILGSLYQSQKGLTDAQTGLTNAQYMTEITKPGLNQSIQGVNESNIEKTIFELQQIGSSWSYNKDGSRTVWGNLKDEVLGPVIDGAGTAAGIYFQYKGMKNIGLNNPNFKPGSSNGYSVPNKGSNKKYSYNKKKYGKSAVFSTYGKTYNASGISTTFQ